MEMSDLTCLELAEPARPPALYLGSERVVLQRMQRLPYLELCHRVGEAVAGNERFCMPAADLDALLAGNTLHLYVLRDMAETALGLCEFDRRAFPDIELTRFGVVPEARGRALGTWMLATALKGEWRSNPDRIWLHTGAWGQASARTLYGRAGFRVVDPRAAALGSF